MSTITLETMNLIENYRVKTTRDILADVKLAKAKEIIRDYLELGKELIGFTTPEYDELETKARTFLKEE
ncbi:MAG: hypothetical protein J6X11_09940 [Treponema sp.]|nr:hypothetical protein [Treponema sp.]